jgi:hypothetical protein
VSICFVPGIIVKPQNLRTWQDFFLTIAAIKKTLNTEMRANKCKIVTYRIRGHFLHARHVDYEMERIPVEVRQIPCMAKGDLRWNTMITGLISPWSIRVSKFLPNLGHAFAKNNPLEKQSGKYIHEKQPGFGKSNLQKAREYSVSIAYEKDAGISPLGDIRFQNRGNTTLPKNIIGEEHVKVA